jgi:hypothetical protein
MTTLKIQVEARFKPILNFFDVYKPIVAPHLKTATGYNIGNQGTYDESILIHYKEENYAIDIRQDRLIFITESRQEKLFEPSGQMFHFFKILEEISKVNTFVCFGSIVLAEWILFESEKTPEIVANEFKEKNIPNAIGSFHDMVIDDYSITQTFNGKTNSFKLVYGPFKRTDVTTYELDNLSKDKTESLKSKNGILSQSILVEKTETIDLEIMKKMDKKINSFLRQLQENVK